MPFGLQPPVIPVLDTEQNWPGASPTGHLPWSLSRHSDTTGRPGETWTDQARGGVQPGPHSGRGPRSGRTDQRLQEDVSDALTRDPHVDATEIEVRVENGEVTLTGTVADRAQKRMAERCVELVRGVREVHNRLRLDGSLGQR